MTRKTTSIPGQATPETSPQASGALRYTSSDLFRGQSEILIEHQGAEYRLRITRSGGLIFNK